MPRDAQYVINTQWEWEKITRQSVANKYAIYFIYVCGINVNGNDTELMMVAHKATTSFQR